MLESRFPAGPARSLDDVLALGVAEPASGRLVVGDQRIRAFLAGVSARLLAPEIVRRHPELGSLGFFLRPSEIDRVLSRLTATAPPQALTFPRGLIFHIPPANVDTLFVYSWALSALVGNRNIVRISPRAGRAATVLLDSLNAELGQAHPVVAQTQQLVSYDRDDTITAALSAACDLRVIWGGDRAVTELRAHPLAAHARDLTFPDRSSFAAISVDGWAAAGTDARRHAAEGLAADAYWFDQAACASPRAVFLVGSADAAAVVRDELLSLLEWTAATRGWGNDPAMAVQRRVEAYGLAATGQATAIHHVGPAVTGIDLTDPAAVPRRWLGAGAFPLVRLGTLAELAAVMERRDQTLTHFGFDTETLAEFAASVGGRGLDRIVPIGSALAFAAIWDGYDLPREFTRLTAIAGLDQPPRHRSAPHRVAHEAPTQHSADLIRG